MWPAEQTACLSLGAPGRAVGVGVPLPEAWAPGESSPSGPCCASSVGGAVMRPLEAGGGCIPGPPRSGRENAPSGTPPGPTSAPASAPSPTTLAHWSGHPTLPPLLEPWEPLPPCTDQAAAHRGRDRVGFPCLWSWALRCLSRGPGVGPIRGGDTQRHLRSQTGAGLHSVSTGPRTCPR